MPWLRRHRAQYDAVIVNGLWQYHSFGYLAGAFHRTSTPYYVFPHGMLDPWFKRRFPLKHLKKWLYWPWADYRVLRDARAVLFTCEQEKLLAPQSFALYRVHPVVTGLGTTTPPDGVDAALLPRPLSGAARQAAAALHGPTASQEGLRSAARGIRRDAWRMTRNGGWSSPARMRPAGSANSSARATALGIADRVVWTGMLRDTQKWSAFAAAEVFALPSHQENFGIAVAESLACSVPVLLSREVNIWREIEDAHAGLVAPDTLDGVIDLLTRWQQPPPEDRSAMRENARACFAQHFDIEQSAARVIEAIEANAGNNR